MSEVEEGTKKTLAMATSQEASPFPGRDCSDPMLNSLVLQTLFKYGSIEEIKTYRQVCRIWNEESLPRIRSRGWVKLVGDKSETNGLYFEDYLDGINEAAATDPFQFRKHPYNNFKLSNFKISLVDGDYGRQLEFWSKCGPKMKQLKISNSCFRSVEDFHAALFRFVPNLKSLKLKDTTVAWSEPGEDDENTIDLKDAPPESTVNSLQVLDIKTVGILPSWNWFFRRYPKIKSFTVSNLLTNMPGFVMAPLTVTKGYELEEILKIMAILARDCGISWELEKLDVLFMCGAHFENRHFELFGPLQLPLTTLCLHIGHFASAEAFKMLLESCANTLRKLVAYRDDDRDHEIRQGFPFGVQLDALSELWLTGRGLRLNLDFLLFTPNLKSLILAQDIGSSLIAASSHVSGHETLGLISCCKMESGGRGSRGAKTVIEGTDFPGLEHLICSNLEELIISGRDEKVCSSGHVAALCRLMPNLKKLMLGLGNDGFRVACEGWKQLEVLIVQPFEVDQIGLTGNDPLQQQRLPNLSDLTGLRYFGMGVEIFGRPNTHLSNESVLNAIFPLKNLEAITAGYEADVDKMSVEIRDQLLSKFPKFIWKSSVRVYEWSGFRASGDTDESSEDDSDDWSDVEENSNDE